MSKKEVQYQQVHADSRSIQNWLEHNQRDPSFAQYKTERNALGCTRCNSATAMEKCKNCGNSSYQLGLAPHDVLGIFCTSCRKGFTSWQCSCGCSNPISERTIFVKKSWCFIATATFEDQDAPEVSSLRAFRDEVLLLSTAGKLFVYCYYALSPHVATIIAKSPKLKALSKTLLTKLVSYLPKHYHNHSD